MLILPGQETLLGSVYSFGALLSFTMAHAAVARLRAKRPDLERPYRGPGNVRIGGYDAPLFALVGGTFTAIAFVVIVVLNLKVAAIGAGWLLVGIVVYVVFRRRQGLDLASTHKVAIAAAGRRPRGGVRLGAGPRRGRRLRRADDGDRGQARRRAGAAGSTCWSRSSVPRALPIDAPLPDAESAADTIIEQAKLQGGGRVSGHWEKVRAGQAGRRIIEEAQDMRATAVVMALPERVPGTSVFGKTIETVLAERPCRVIIESRPPARRQAGRRGGRPRVTA